ncbi:hypothetical protein ACIBLB_19520 [Streptosporangium canum]|uniref:hypothetical protein n=1 Tax=Streptosporangium canum TaxID=324952 RepID=UPI0037BCA846
MRKGVTTSKLATPGAEAAVAPSGTTGGPEATAPPWSPPARPVAVAFAAAPARAPELGGGDPR